MKNSQGDDFFLIDNPNNDKIYIYSNENQIDETKKSIYLGSEKIQLNSLEGESPSLFLREDNGLGFPVTDKNTLSFQAVNGRVILERNSKEGFISDIKFSGESIVTLDKRSFIGSKDNSKFYYNKERFAGDFNHGDSSVSSKITYINNEGNEINSFDIYSNNYNNYAAIDREQFPKGVGDLKFFKTKDETYVSPTLAFNQLTQETQKLFDSLTNKEIEEFSNQLDITNVGKLDRSIKNYYANVRNPVKASVKVLGSKGGGGGSGTIIGYEEINGGKYPLILTAAHVRQNAKTKYIKMQDGRAFYAKEIGRGKGTIQNPQYEYGEDIAVLQATSPVNGFSFIPVANENHVLLTGSSGDTVTRHGHDDLGPLRTDKGYINTLYKNKLGFNDRSRPPIPGASGSGLFHNGKLVGVTSVYYHSGAGYSSFRSVIKLLEKLGKDHVIPKFIIIFN